VQQAFGRLRDAHDETARTDAPRQPRIPVAVDDGERCDDGIVRDAGLRDRPLERGRAVRAVVDLRDPRAGGQPVVQRVLAQVRPGGGIGRAAPLVDPQVDPGLRKGLCKGAQACLQVGEVADGQMRDEQDAVGAREPLGRNQRRDLRRPVRGACRFFRHAGGLRAR
jgi:hypothetical protein